MNYVGRIRSEGCLSLSLSCRDVVVVVVVVVSCRIVSCRVVSCCVVLCRGSDRVVVVSLSCRDSVAVAVLVVVLVVVLRLYLLLGYQLSATWSSWSE